MKGTHEEPEWKECVAQALKSDDLGDVMMAATAMDRTLCSAGSGELKGEDRDVVLKLVQNEKAAPVLRQHAIRVLVHVKDTSEDTMKMIATCFGAKTTAEVVAEATTYFLKMTTNELCAFSTVADTIRSIASSSEEVALRLIECVLNGLKSLYTKAWRNDATAMFCLGALPKMLESPDIVIVLNALELLDNTEKWNDEECDADAQLPPVVRLAASTSAFSLVRVAAIRSLGGIAARGPGSFGSAIKHGAFDLIQKLMAQDDDEEIAIAAMTALSHAVSTAGVDGIGAILERYPSFFETLLAAEGRPWAGNKTHLMVTHALAHMFCAPGRDSERGTTLMKINLFDKLVPNPAEVISDSVKMATCNQEDRSRAGTHLLTSLSFHSWGVEALLSDSAFTGKLLVQNYPFFTNKERFQIATNILHFRPDYAHQNPSLGLLVSRGPSYTPAVSIIESSNR